MKFTLYTSLLIFLVMNVAWVSYDPTAILYDNVFRIRIYDYSLYFGIDGISFVFMYLTSLITPLCLLYSIGGPRSSRAAYMSCILSVEILLLLVFSTLDLLLFYIFFEMILVPFIIMIGLRGSRRRKIHASYLLFFYTLFGSVLMLFGIFAIYMSVGSTDMQILWLSPSCIERSHFAWWAFFVSFSVKVPVLPFHIWLPEAHVESPTEGSVLLAGILLKVGLYGYLRVLLQMFHVLSTYYYSIIVLAAVISIFYTSLTTLRQTDIKRIIAYSSVAHMNLCIVGIASFNTISLCGSVMLMFCHGIVSSGLFFMVGMLYDRFGTRIVRYYSGLTHMMPLASILFFAFVLGNISMPGTGNFLGELLVLCGSYTEYGVVPVMMILFGILCCTIYTLWLYNKIFFGMLNTRCFSRAMDVTYREFHVVLPLAICMLALGLYPRPFIDTIYYTIAHTYSAHILC